MDHPSEVSGHLSPDPSHSLDTQKKNQPELNSPTSFIPLKCLFVFDLSNTMGIVCLDPHFRVLSPLMFRFTQPRILDERCTSYLQGSNESKSQGTRDFAKRVVEGS